MEVSDRLGILPTIPCLTLTSFCLTDGLSYRLASPEGRVRQNAGPYQQECVNPKSFVADLNSRGSLDGNILRVCRYPLNYQLTEL